MLRRSDFTAEAKSHRESKSKGLVSSLWLCVSVVNRFVPRNYED